MPHARRRLGDTAIPGFTPSGVVADNTSIDWNSVIEQGLQVVGQAINGQPIPTYYPTYTPTTTAIGSASSLLPLALIGIAVYALTQSKR